MPRNKPKSKKIQAERPEQQEQTGKQLAGMATVATGYSGGTQLVNPLPASYRTYRKMRKHPTISLARMLAMAPVMAAEWSIEHDDEADERWVEFIRDQFIDIREPFIESTLGGTMDFGWQPFEQVFEAGDWQPRDGSAPADRLITLRKLKPLMQDLTTILVDEHGSFMGYEQGPVRLPLANCLHMAFRVEGTQWHGESLLEHARETWNSWRDAEEGAGRYDRKIAGSHWVVYYPVGQTEMMEGAKKDNADIASEILNALESSGSMTIPQQVANQIDDFNRSLGRPAWDVQILADSGGRQPTFIERLAYLDKLLVRALHLPERTILEAEHGTRADAGEHIDLILTAHELTHRHVTRMVNWHSVNRLLVWNFGPEAEGRVWLSASPIVDSQKEFFKKVYQSILTNPGGFLEEFEDIDRDSLREQIGIPKREDAEGERMPRGQEGVDPNDPRADQIRDMLRRMQPTRNGNGRMVEAD